ncbi:hypothetical protein DEH83_09405 [Streptococcus constellatus]|nr:hypothetical protein DEH83_09405 [Streptococcus constellatus]
MKVLFICYNKDIIKGIDDVSFAPVGGQASVDTTSAASSYCFKEKVEKSCLILFLCKRSFYKIHLRRSRELAIIMNIRKRFLPQGDNDD